MNPSRHREFIPALRYDVLTPLYDAGIRLTMPERRFKTQLLRAAAIRPGDRVLDVGCGTGTLLRLATEIAPQAAFFGVDPDERILARAASKLRDVQPPVSLERGSATKLPYDGASFDRVLSSLVVHHLAPDAKQQAFAEILRVLRPEGEFHVADFGAPDSLPMRFASFLTEKVGQEEVRENFRGLLPSMIRTAGFSRVEETGRFATMFGVVRLMKCTP